MKRCFLLLLLTGLFNLTALGFQNEVEYLGKLDPQLVVDSGMGGMSLKKATPEQLAALPAAIGKEEQAFGGHILEAPRINYAGVSIILLEKAKGLPQLFVDLDENGKFSEAERFNLSPVKDERGDAGQAVVQIPLKKGDFKLFPVKFSYPIGQSAQDETRLLSTTFSAYARGTVDIQGRKTLVQYQVYYPAGEINLTKGYLGVDTNGDGQIDSSFISYESTFAKDETIVFRAGNTYVSTKSVDTVNGQIILQAHPAADYERVELEIGGELGDFNFTDFNGKGRKLSEFRGKYLLVEFWGSWCGPCVREVANFKEAYARYRSRGFEILGMDEDQSVDDVKKFLTEKGINWTNATTPSIKELTAKRFRIIAFPTTMLLDPNGKIISFGRKNQMPLRGKELMETLEKLLPAGQN
jgi:peroxiredoxin